MAATLKLARSAAGYQDRQRIVIVRIAVTHAAAIEHDGVIEQMPSPVGGGAQLLREGGEHLHVVAAYEGEGIHAGAPWKPSRTPLAGNVAPVVSRAYIMVEMRVIVHELDVIFEGLGDSNGRIGDVHFIPGLIFGFLDAALDFADVIGYSSNRVLTNALGEQLVHGDAGVNGTLLRVRAAEENRGGVGGRTASRHCTSCA